MVTWRFTISKGLVHGHLASQASTTMTMTACGEGCSSHSRKKWQTQTGSGQEQDSHKAPAPSDLLPLGMLPLCRCLVSPKPGPPSVPEPVWDTLHSNIYYPKGWLFLQSCGWCCFILKWGNWVEAGNSLGLCCVIGSCPGSSDCDSCWLEECQFDGMPSCWLLRISLLTQQRVT